MHTLCICMCVFVLWDLVYGSGIRFEKEKEKNTDIHEDPSNLFVGLLCNFY